MSHKCKICGKPATVMMSTDIMHPLNESGIWACKKHDVQVWEETFKRMHPSNKRKLLREELAALEHDQWVFWSKDIASKEKLSEDRLARWAKLWVPYNELTEEYKDMDRVWADKTLKLIYRKDDE